jgi:hypothetical protein
MINDIIIRIRMPISERVSEQLHQLRAFREAPMDAGMRILKENPPILDMDFLAQAR